VADDRTNRVGFTAATATRLRGAEPAIQAAFVALIEGPHSPRAVAQRRDSRGLRESAISQKRKLQYAEFVLARRRIILHSEN